MKKMGIICLFGTFFQLIITIVAYEFYWVFKLVNGGVGGSVLDQVHPLIWLTLMVELVLSLVLVFNFQGKQNRE